MSKQKVLTLIAALGLVAMATVRFGSSGRAPDGDGTDFETSAARRASGSATTEQEIQFFQQRVAKDPRDFISLTCLSELQVRRARQTGNFAEYEQAAASARAALALRERYAPAMVQLAATYAAEHRFHEALELARKAFALDRMQYGALLIVGDCQMALGEYQSAEQVYRDVQRQAPGPTASARLAHLLEMRGDYDSALELIRSAVKVMTDRRAAMEELAWYQTLLGDLYFETGRLEQAARTFEAALDGFDDYHVALAGLGRVRTAEGRFEEAIELYRRAAESSPQIGTLAHLGDLYAKAGDAASAQVCFSRIESLPEQPGARPDLLRRDLALFYADHDRNLVHALALADADLAVRRDIFAHDARAWTLYKNSRLAEAAAAIEQALKLGNRHPTLCYHAGMIYYGLGKNEKAASYLRRAIAMNPQFSLLYADEARRTLAKLGEMTHAETASTGD